MVAYNNALLRSPFVCSNGVTVDATPPLLGDVRAEGVRIRPGLIKYTSGSSTQLWLLTEDGVRHSVSDLSCAANATAVPSPDAFIGENYATLFNEFAPNRAPFQNTYAYQIYHGYSTLRGNWTKAVDTSRACRYVPLP